jgi:hypothetical protein
MGTDIEMTTEELESMQIKILSYFGVRDQVYDTLTQLSRSSLCFLRKNRDMMEDKISSHASEKARLIQVKSIEEHQSGVNQIIKLSNKEIITASDDCYIKYWAFLAGQTKTQN